MKTAEKWRRLAAVKKRMDARRDQRTALRERLAIAAEMQADAEQMVWLRAAPVHDDAVPDAEVTP